MVNSLLDDVNELLRLSYGDENRLEDIKRRLEDGLTIYNSDINYLKKLVENHKDEIQENTESKSTTTESESTTTGSEPLPVDDELEELEEEKTREKHSGGNLKKMGFVILATAAVISVFFAIGSLEEKGWIGSDESTKNISTDTKQPVIFTGTHEDLLRHEYDHVGKIVSIQGYVTQTDASSGKYYFGATNSRDSLWATEYYYIQGYSERLLRGDYIMGYGTYTGICTENRIGDPFTCFSNVRLFGHDFDNASNGDYGICTDEIATKFSLCNK